MKAENGFTDNPLELEAEDLLGIKKYTEGLKEFIKCCNTPMTIAIQGDWGSGKTSFMNLIRNKLGKDAEIIWFNTWQFSQFNMQENVSLMFLNYVKNVLEKYMKDSLKIKGKVAEKFTKASSFVCKLTSYACDAATQSDVGKRIYEQIFDSDSIDAIEQLKKEFQDNINSICKETKKDKIVFFVDDLDRLQPLRAVELLEVLKIFLDCEHCVFILAIDYEVVSQGITQKYNGTLDEEKGRKFFEKIIQLPFKMPVAQYDIKGYVERTFKDLGMNIDLLKDDYIEIIKNSVGCNPRTMKRTFNAFLLLTKVGYQNKEMTEGEQFYLFACLCMQLVFEDMYSYFVQHMSEDNVDSDGIVIDEEFLDGITKGDIQDGRYDELREIICNSELYDEEQAIAFLKAFCKVFSCNDKKRMIDDLKSVLKMTPIMSTSTKSSSVREKNEYKYEEEYEEVALNEIIKNIKNRSLKKCIIRSFYIPGRNVDFENGTSISDLYRELIEYAYEKKPNEFKEFRESAMNNEGDKFRKFFRPEDTSVPNSKIVVTENEYRISTNYGNDAKMYMIRDLYSALKLGFEDIKVVVKYAYLDK